MMLKAIAIGRLCKDPDLRYTPGGKAVASIRLACDRSRAKNETDFIMVICWEKQAETIANNLQSGRLIFVEGQLQILVCGFGWRGPNKEMWRNGHK